MARNVPGCGWVVNSSFESPDSYVTVNGNNCFVDVNGTCSACLYTELTDPFVYTLIVIYSVILTIGFFGNLAVIIIILSVPKLRIVINLLLVALAFSDIVVTIAMPYSFLNMISYEYHSSLGICKGVPMLQGTAIMGGIYTLVVVAVERYNVTVKPFHDRMLKNRMRIAVCVCTIWLISACLQVPLVIVLDIENIPKLISATSQQEVDYCGEICMSTSRRLCVETWNDESAIGFSYAVLFAMYLIPLSCISYLYYKIGRTMWQRRPVGRTSSKETRHFQRKKRLITFMIVLVGTFAILWGPYFIMHCLRDPIENIYLRTALKVMGHSNVAVDPILYAFFHRNVRKQACFYLRRAGLLRGRPTFHSEDDLHSASVVGRTSSVGFRDTRIRYVTSVSGNMNATTQNEETRNGPTYC